jgi:serine/threonine-protein kinase RsbT
MNPLQTPTAMPESFNIAISEEAHIAEAQHDALLLAQQSGFSRTDAYYLATAVTELAANIFRHAGDGEIHLHALVRHGAAGIEVIARDTGPGIADIEQAMREGFSTAGGLGCGLPGVSRLMDELEIRSKVGQGTQIRACKWVTVARTVDYEMMQSNSGAPY